MSDSPPSPPSTRRVLKLTLAWTPLKPHAMQASYLWHPASIKVCTAGRRSGKTMLAKRKGVLQLIKQRPWPAKIFFAAPTFDQARRIFWDDLKALIPEPWKAKTNESRMEITTRWGAMAVVVGLDKPQRIEGIPWDWGVIDEMADAKKGFFGANIVPAMSTLGRKIDIDLIGVPDAAGPNQEEYEALFDQGLHWPNSQDVCSFSWPSADILEPEKIERLRQLMDPAEAEQELMGRFVKTAGRAFPLFSPAIHVQAEPLVRYDPSLPIDWSLDFGFAHCASVIGQSHRGRVWVLDEIALERSSTDDAATAFRERCSARGYDIRRLRVFGDAAGNAHGSALGVSDYDILRKRLGDLPDVRWLQFRDAPLIKDTLNAVRGRIASADHVAMLHVHPRCVKLIGDLKSAPWPDANKLADFHWLAALRYYAMRLFGESATSISTGPVNLPWLRAAESAIRPGSGHSATAGR